MLNLISSSDLTDLSALGRLLFRFGLALRILPAFSGGMRVSWPWWLTMCVRYGAITAASAILCRDMEDRKKEMTSYRL